jgi:hypothetical protein
MNSWNVWETTPGEETAGLGHNMEVANSSIKSVDELKYLVTTLTDQNSIQE